MAGCWQIEEGLRKKKCDSLFNVARLLFSKHKKRAQCRKCLLGKRLGLMSKLALNTEYTGTTSLIFTQAMMAAAA